MGDAITRGWCYCMKAMVLHEVVVSTWGDAITRDDAIMLQEVVLLSVDESINCFHKELVTIIMKSYYCGYHDPLESITPLFHTHRHDGLLSQLPPSALFCHLLFVEPASGLSCKTTTSWHNHLGAYSASHTHEIESVPGRLGGSTLNYCYYGYYNY